MHPSPIVVKLVDTIAAQAVGTVKQYVWDGVADTMSLDTASEIEAYNMGPSEAPAGAEVLVNFYSGIPVFSYTAAGGGAATGFEVGDIVIKLRDDADVTINDHKWLSLCLPGDNGAARSVGDASSGATAWAHADADDIFTYLWEQVGNTELPLQDSGGSPVARGVSAAADFAAHRRMPLPDPRMRHLIPQGMGPDSPAPTLYPMGATEGEAADDRTTSINLEHGHNITALGTSEDGMHDHGIPSIDTDTADGWSSPETEETSLGVYSDPDTTGALEGTSDNELYVSPNPHKHALSETSLGHYHNIPASTFTTEEDGPHTHTVSGTSDTNTDAATLPFFIHGLYILAKVPA